MSLPVGRYEGRTLVRVGREDELSRKELAGLKKSRETITLELRPNGSFVWKKSFEGTFERSGAVLIFRPERFSGQTVQEMRSRSEAMGRQFNLEFIFNAFELRIEGELLVTADQESLLYVEYVKVAG